MKRHLAIKYKRSYQRCNKCFSIADKIDKGTHTYKTPGGSANLDFSSYLPIHQALSMSRLFILHHDNDTYLCMLLTHQRFFIISGWLIIGHCLLFRFNRMILCDFQPLMCLHAAITNKFGAFNTPRCSDCIVCTTATFDNFRLIFGAFCVDSAVIYSLYQELMQYHTIRRTDCVTFLTEI